MLFVVYVRKKQIVVYDSVDSESNDQINNQLHKLKDWVESPDVFGGSWTKKYKADTPEQENSCDCGVFVCMTADFGADQATPDNDDWIKCTQADIEFFRKRMACRLQQGDDSLKKEESGEQQNEMPNDDWTLPES